MLFTHVICISRDIVNPFQEYVDLEFEFEVRIRYFVRNFPLPPSVTISGFQRVVVVLSVSAPRDLSPAYEKAEIFSSLLE
jgi:hypothetical protein